MGTCNVCNTRKAKRKCINGEETCPLCCGTTRNSDKCEGCQYFSGGGSNGNKRNYKEISRYSAEIIAENFSIQSKCQNIEFVIVEFDKQNNQKINDEIVLKALEKTLDKFHFKNETLIFENELIEELFEMIVSIIDEFFGILPETETSKILASIWYYAQKRSKGRREYLDFIKNYII